MVKKNSTKTKVQPYEIGELDHYLFGQGNHYEIYKKMGAHEVTKNGKRGVYFAVWAPHAVTVAEVKEVMDDAIAHSQKASAKKLVKRVFGKNTDSSDRILLSEKDFNI